MLDQAIAFAAIAHAGQRRKYTGDPYIVHPLEVMSIVRTVSEREDMAVAAVLHDVIEDTPVQAREIERRFGAPVRRLVEELTEVEVPGNRAVRKAAECERLSQVSAEAQTIKVADLISNTRTIAAYDPNFAKIYLAEKRTLLDRLNNADFRLILRAEAQLENEGY